MNRRIFIIILMTTMFCILMGCNQKEFYESDTDVTKVWYEPETVEILSTDVVEIHGDVKNINLLDDFVMAAEQGIVKTQRLIRYTIEGDPIINYMTSGANGISNKIDATKDQYGGGTHYEVFDRMFSRKVLSEGKNYIEYVVLIDDKEHVFIRAKVD